MLQYGLQYGGIFGVDAGTDICHRAFLVNTRYITHVDGNSSACHAGCRMARFSLSARQKHDNVAKIT